MKTTGFVRGGTTAKMGKSGGRTWKLGRSPFPPPLSLWETREIFKEPIVGFEGAVEGKKASDRAVKALWCGPVFSISPSLHHPSHCPWNFVGSFVNRQKETRKLDCL